MSATFRVGLKPHDLNSQASQAPKPDWRGGPALGGGRLAWIGGLGALGGLCLAVALLLPGLDSAPERPASPAEALALLAPPKAEPATLGGVNRALAALERDLSVWHRILAPEVGAGAVPPQAEIPEPLPEPIATTGSDQGSDLGSDPGRTALIALAVTLAAVTLLAGIVALLLERLVLAPFRALRGVAAALAAGSLEREVPGTWRHDEAGALARNLERLRRTALTAREEDGIAWLSPEAAAERIALAAQDIGHIAALTAARALEAGLTHAEDEAAHRKLAQEAGRLAEQVAILREAAEATRKAVLNLSERPARAEPSRIEPSWIPARAAEKVPAG